ncbi:MAG: hypothetical protein AAB403_08255 [Planctomycetota bacterium]
MDDCDLPRPTAAAVFTATGAGKTRAYEVAEQILDGLPNLLRPPGRPAGAPAEPLPPRESEAISREVIDYFIAHPGCVTGTARRRYSDGYRQFVVALYERNVGVTAAAFADAVRVPKKTLADWLATGCKPPAAEPAEPVPNASNPRIQTILAAWDAWQGPFRSHAKITSL